MAHIGPEEYEHLVADVLRREGWEATVTPPTNDNGVDVLAKKDGRRMAVQVKMYGGARKINKATVMELYGAAAFHACEDAMIATDGELMPDAEVVAEKLGITVKNVARPSVDLTTTADSFSSLGHNAIGFDLIWNQDIKALEGQTLTRTSGKSNSIESVDDAGLIRVTSNGRKQRIDIEIFRWTINRLLAGEIVRRSEINEMYPRRASSGIVLILSSLAFFEIVRSDGSDAIRLCRP